MDKIKGLTVAETRQVVFTHWCISSNIAITANTNIAEIVANFNAMEILDLNTIVHSINEQIATRPTKPKVARRKKGGEQVVGLSKDVPTLRDGYVGDVDAKGEADADADDTNNSRTLLIDISNPACVDGGEAGQVNEIRMEDLKNMMIDISPDVKVIDLLFVEFENVDGTLYYKDEKGNYYDTTSLKKLPHKVNVFEMNEKKSPYFQK